MAEIETVMSKSIGTELEKQAKRLAQEKVREALKSPIKQKKQRDFMEEDDEFLEFDSEVDDDEIEDEDEVDHEDSEFETTEFNSRAVLSDDLEKLVKEAEKRDAYDIFSEIGDALEKQGQVVRYTVMKSGKLLTSLDHPVTWEDIQARFGGGNYKVIAKLPALGNKYIKSQTKQIAPSPSENPTYLLNSIANKAKEKDETKAPTIDEVMRMMQAQQESEERRRRYEDERNEQTRRELEERARLAREEAKAEAAEKLSAQERLMEKMLEMNKPKADSNGSLIRELTPIITALAPLLMKREEPKDTSKDTFEMMMRMQEMNNKMFESLSKNTEKQMSALQESIREIAKQNSQPKEDKYDALSLLKLAQDSESRAFEKFNLMNELASEKARELAEAREDASPSFDKESSTFDKLLTTLGPAVVSALAAPRTTPQITQAPVQAPTRSPLPQPRSSVSSNNPRSSNSTGRANQERVIRNQIPTTAQTKAQGISSVNEGRVSSSQRPNSVGPSVLDLLPTTEATPVIAAPVVLEASKNLENVERINSIIFPLALAAFTDETATIESTADRALFELEANGVVLSTVTRDFDEETLSAILEIVPDETHYLVKDLRNAIIRKIQQRG